ncbi:MAG: slipin family protein [Chloroflexi bacterium]|nr:MAG: slipin family protein [Chloroflexota bacterium]RLC96033.1 MAG: slipin family protein [Chloroflexota bacterium]
MEALWAVAIVAVLAIFILPSAIKVVTQYERGVVLRLGRFIGIKEPGLRLIIPFIDRMYKVDTRVVTMDVPEQEIITRDNVTVTVNAVVYMRVINPEDAVLEVADYLRATSLIAQTTLRSVLGQSELDELLSERDKINSILQQIVDEQTDPWGVKVSAVEIKDVTLPDTMQRAMAAQAEAEREKRAKIVHAEGELQASEKLAQAAAVISTQPAALQLRYLGTLTDIATERTSMVIFPLPMDMISAFTKRALGEGGQVSGGTST